MLEKAKWIWTDAEAHPRNKWVRFRREIAVSGTLQEAAIEITADSRYWLFINGHRIHQGPNKAFPERYQYDRLDITRYLVPGTNRIEVEVNSIGMDTHQYLLGRAGLAAAISLRVDDGEEQCVTDEEWLCTENFGFLRNNIRISAGQAYSELYDANLPLLSWQAVHVLGPVGMKPWGELERSLLPAATMERKSALRVLEANEVRSDGKTMHVDLHALFVGEVRAPEFFYLVTRIHVPEEMECDLTFPYSRLWCIYGDFMINGREYATEMRAFVFEPVAEGSKTVRVQLDKGENLFAMRMDNVAMGMHVSMHFDCGETDLRFESPFPDPSAFCAITSLLHPDSHRVNLKEGEWMNRPCNPDVDDEQKEKARVFCWESLRHGRTDGLASWHREIGERSVSAFHPQVAILMQKKLCAIPLDRNVENLILDNLNACLLKPGADKDFLLDFGEEVSGYLFFEIDVAEAGEILDFSGFEYRDWFGVNQEMDGVNNGFRYLTKKGAQRFVSRYNRGFRYLNVTIRHRNDVKIRQIGLYQSTYPVTRIGEFQCDDDRLNRIYEISERTTKLCMHDTFVDCPGHERSFWIGDFRNEALISQYLYNASGIIENGHRIGLGALRTGILPKASVPSEPQGITPTWTLLWLMSYWELYFYRPDNAMRQYYEEMKQCVEVFVSRIREDGLVRLEWNDMMDWAPMDILKGCAATNINAELCRVLDSFAKLAGIFGHASDGERFSDIATRLRERIVALLWDPEKQAFADSRREGVLSTHFSVQANCMAYLCDCCSPMQAVVIERYLREGFPAGFQKINSPFASFFHYEAMEKAGNADELVGDIRYKWGEMLDYGATTCFETFPGWEKQILTRSHCHAWSAAPCYFFPRNILGIKPMEPGFASVRIEPHLGNLKWAHGAVPVPGGRMVVHAWKEGAALRIHVRKPQNIRVLVPETCSCTEENL